MRSTNGNPVRPRRPGERRAAQVGIVLLSGAPFRSRAHFMEVNRGVPLAVLEAHCLEACALREARKNVEWASDYGGFDRLDESR